MISPVFTSLLFGDSIVMNNEMFSTVCPCGSSGSVESQAKQRGIQLIGGDNQISF